MCVCVYVFIWGGHLGMKFRGATGHVREVIYICMCLIYVYMHIHIDT